MSSVPISGEGNRLNVYLQKILVQKVCKLHIVVWHSLKTEDKPDFQSSLRSTLKESSSHAARKYRYWISKLRESNFKAFKPITNPYNWPQDPRDSFTAAGSDGEDGGHTAGRAGTVVPLSSRLR